MKKGKRKSWIETVKHDPNRAAEKNFWPQIMLLVGIGVLVTSICLFIEAW